MQAVSDEQLIIWVAQGDESCLGTLFERHHRSVYQYCYQLIRNQAQAEDLTQDIFLKIYKKAGKYKSTGSFKAWLFSVARNTTLDYLRKAKRSEYSWSGDESSVHELVDQISPEREVSEAQTLSLLARALANLPADVQDIIWLGRFEFDSYEELGLALSCKPATARVRMHRAMQRLNDEFMSISGAPING